MSSDTDASKVYSAKEVSVLLGIQNTTVRKYSQLLEKAGYHIHKNELGHRGFFDKDVIVLRKIIELTKRPDMSLENAINVVVSTDAGSDISKCDMQKSMTYQEILEDNQRLLKKFEDFKNQQLEFNKELLQQLKKRDDYIATKLEQRDQSLMNTIREMHDTQKLIATTKQPSKKWWEFWK
ncbi:DUF3967 domain-containing protein [Priestia filamentosa]|uniref:DUF3967 domain-containing protein n=1 Tax=Priestia filamentosa TaxID=1402861 RepID=UPI001FB1CD6A|nr:DUF3967 domain-containing protein [Priestia filamentosa]UOE62902.1 DUF3967 domain-containing protein [Priestia filamentosa]